VGEHRGSLLGAPRVAHPLHVPGLLEGLAEAGQPGQGFADRGLHLGGIQRRTQPRRHGRRPRGRIPAHRRLAEVQRLDQNLADAGRGPHADHQLGRRALRDSREQDGDMVGGQVVVEGDQVRGSQRGALTPQKVTDQSLADMSPRAAERVIHPCEILGHLRRHVILVVEDHGRQQRERADGFRAGNVGRLGHGAQPAGPGLPHRGEPDPVGPLQRRLGNPQLGLHPGEHQRLLEAALRQGHPAGQHVLQRLEVLALGHDPRHRTWQRPTRRRCSRSLATRRSRRARAD